MRVEGELAAPMSSLGRRGGTAQVGGGRETGLEGRVEEENGRSEDRDREAEAGGEKKSKPGGGKADKGREEG